MRLLQAEGDDLVLVDMNEDSAPYAILSHRWLAAKEEVLFRDIDNKVSKEMLKAKEGWKKLQWCREQAARDGYQYVWADTACIDKSSSQELTESINSMYRWYQKAGVCYVYLNDMPDGLERNEAPSIGVRDEVVQTSTFAESNRPFTEPSVQYQLKIEDSSASGGLPQVLTLALPQQAHCNPKYGEPRDLDRHDLESQLRKSCANGENPMRATISGLESTTWEEWDRVAFGESQWFTRAWTLQEMIASKEVRFYSQSWQLIGRLTELAKDVTAITGVHEEVLMDNSTVNSYSIAQRMSWAAYRESTKVEDRAYSLLGILDVAMPVVYGENERAFERLQEELLRTSSDDSIFAFDIAKKIAQVDGQRTTTLLATSPSDFADCGDIVYLGHKAGTEHEVFTKQINFTLTTTTEAKDLHKKHGDWRWFFDFVTFLVLFPILAPIMVISGALNGSRPMTAFLNCRRTNTPEVMLGLCLVPQVRGRRQTAFFVEPFFVQGIAHRVATYNLYGRRYVGGRQKTFSVIRTPGMVHANTRHSLAVICSSRTAHTLLTPISSKPKCVMLAREEAATVFTIPTIPPNMHSDLNVELEVRMHDRKVAQVHMDMRPSRWRFIQLRVQGRALHLPDWTTWALFKDAYSSSIKWHKGGFLIVRGFATRVPFTRKDVLLLECEHVGGLTRLTYLIGRRLIVSVPSILLLALPAMIFGAALYSVVSKSRLFLLASIPVGVASIAFYRQLDNWRRAEWL